MSIAKITPRPRVNCIVERWFCIMAINRDKHTVSLIARQGSKPNENKHDFGRVRIVILERGQPNPLAICEPDTRALYPNPNREFFVAPSCAST